MNASLNAFTLVKHSLNHRTSKRIRHTVLSIAGLMLIGFSSVAASAYQYTYSGNTITGTLTNYHPFEPQPYVTTEDFTGAIFVSFTSQTLLTGPLDMTGIDSFMMGGETTPSFYGNGTITGNWVYPYPFPTVAYNSYGEFNIYSVDANGLPTDWNIKMFGDAGYTRHTYSNFETTPNIDKIYGYSEYGYEWTGETVLNKGQWIVTAVVPEPETYAMLLAGLGMVGFVARRRQSKLLNRSIN